MNDKMLELIHKTVASGAANGAAREIYYSESRELETSACKGAIDTFTDSRSGAASARAVLGRKMGSAFTERISAESLKEAMDKAASSAAFMDEDEGNVLYEGREELSVGLGRDWENDAVPAATKKGLALGIEKGCYGADKRIVNVPQAGYGEVDLVRAIANGRGMLKVERHTFCYAGAYVMASSGDATETGQWLEVAPNFAGLHPEKIAAMAVADAVDKLGAREPESGNYRAVITNDAATALLGAFMGSTSAEAMQKGKSRLAGKLGQKVGSSRFTLIDDPAGPGIRHAAFDDEGLPSGRLEVFREGVFLEPLHTLYSARRECAKPNGRGFRSSPTQAVSAALVNAFIPAGESAQEGLIAAVGKGILITDVQGLHAGLNPVSGDFSCSARGFAIEGGKRSQALRNFTVSGNFYDLIAGIEAVGSDLRHDVFDHFRSPSLAIASLSVSGGD